MVLAALTGLPVLPSDLVKLDHVLLRDIYLQLGINFGDRIFARTLDGDKDDLPLENITWRQLLVDATKVANTLKKCLGEVCTHGEKLTFALLANSDYAYYVNIVAGWLNGWTILLLSVRNSVAGNCSLLKAAKAKAIFTDNRNRKTAEEVAQELPTQVLDIVHPDQVYEDVKLLDGPIEVSMASPREFKEVALYLQSSGTSGYPKLIPCTHEFFVTDMMTIKINKTYFPNTPAYTPLPLFHGIGLFCFTRWPIAAGHIPTFINTRLPLTSASLLRHLKRFPGALCFLVPNLLEDSLREPPEDFAVLKTVKSILFGGAPLDKATCKELVERGAPLVQQYGANEMNLVTELDFPGSPEDKAFYVKFCENKYSFHWEPYDGKLSELIVCPGKIAAPAVLNHSNPAGYATNDLWEPHQTIPGLYKHCGRKGTITVLSNGEKTDNRQIELLMTECPLINGVIVFGAGRPLNGILVRPNTSSAPFTSPSDFLDSIWPTIEYINTIIPSHSRILRQMVIVADLEKKPFVESDKGSIRTKDTLTLYDDEISAAYEALEMERDASVKDIKTPSQIREYVQKVVGFDSLHAIQVRIELKPVFDKFVKGEVFEHNIAYDHPTISRLSAYLVARSKGEVLNSNDAGTLLSRVEHCVERWTGSLPERHPAELTPRPGNAVVALTGSTGSLGVHTLLSLLKRGDVKRVFCLHRGSSEVAAQRQRALFRDRALPIELLDSDKVVFLEIDLSKPGLGLPSGKYEELRKNLTHIIHTAWELNFNWNLEHFERVHIAGVRHLIDLAAASTLTVPPRIVFISSVDVVSRWKPGTPVPEQPFTDPTLVGSRGYSQAKFVSESVLNQAAEKTGVPVTIIRSGQISGSSLDGYWAPTEFIPTIFRSSKILGKDTRWLPADYCGKAVVDLSLQDNETLQYYHLENPTSTSWSVVASLFAEFVETKIEQVDMKDWLLAVEQATKKGVEIPAAPLVQFYSEYSSADWKVVLGTDKAAQTSTAIQYGPVTAELMRKYTSWF
ncbi:hypothetical protein NP233_g2511 [Leucocoprinus birnbaumii]|uniref:Uncharacterized protein n=1 Tax=Leucocoprinus birnbaumii TaxID=56174 RepID=A0AAD5W078_9AGAR|nr:hypothetical protein NP233_g2511 [Leucocoprinus birnbaumii]